MRTMAFWQRSPPARARGGEERWRRGEGALSGRGRHTAAVALRHPFCGDDRVKSTPPLGGFEFRPRGICHRTSRLPRGAVHTTATRHDRGSVYEQLARVLGVVVFHAAATDVPPGYRARTVADRSHGNTRSSTGDDAMPARSVARRVGRVNGGVGFESLKNIAKC